MKILGVCVTPLKHIKNPKGDILHVIKVGDQGFEGFGETYFSMANQGEKKAWKKHLRMTLNLVVPIGCVRFVVFDDREGSPTSGLFDKIDLSIQNYCRLTVPPGVWMGFMGLSSGTNLLVNVADIEHDPEEAVRKEVEEISYDWQY